MSAYEKLKVRFLRLKKSSDLRKRRLQDSTMSLKALRSELESVRAKLLEAEAREAALKEREKAAIKKLHAYQFPGTCRCPDCARRSPCDHKGMEAVVEAAKQKYRSIVFTSGVSEKFADAELVKAVEVYLAALPKPAAPAPEPAKACPCGCDKTVAPGSCHHFGGYDSCPKCAPSSQEKPAKGCAHGKGPNDYCLPCGRVNNG